MPGSQRPSTYGGSDQSCQFLMCSELSSTNTIRKAVSRSEGAGWI